jgi:hypothetical protein
MRDVVAHQLEMSVVQKMLDVPARAREEVVEAKHLTTEIEEPFAQVGPQEPGASRHQHSTLEMHRFAPFPILAPSTTRPTLR